ncbi:MAG: hypothetical protein HQ512_10855 [Rhodospirillales bacterium]|nr:hypothetical protein [Rhodospirillales bacterium]
MNFSRLSLLLRLPLVVLFCGQLAYLGDNVPQDDYLTSAEQVVVSFEERDDNTSFDVGLPVDIFDDALIQQSDWVSWDLGYVANATLELHATGPPNV